MTERMCCKQTMSSRHMRGTTVDRSVKTITSSNIYQWFDDMDSLSLRLVLGKKIDCSGIAIRTM